MPNNETNNGTIALAKEFEGIKKPAEYRITATWNNVLMTSENIDWTNKDLNGLLAHVDDGLSVQISKFITQEDADAFVSHFPKFVKATTCRVYGTDAEYFGVSFYVRWTSKVTGTHNEIGMKRTKKFVEILNKMK